jgi:hypothetical protein
MTVRFLKQWPAWSLCLFFPGAILGSPASRSGHDGPTIAVPYSRSAPAFQSTGRSPRGCDTSGPAGYAAAPRISIDAGVAVFVLHTDDDLFFCFTGIDLRLRALEVAPAQDSFAAVYLERLPARSAAAANARFLFRANPAASAGAIGTALTGANLATPLPALAAGSATAGGFRVSGADARAGESTRAWNAEIRVGKALLTGDAAAPWPELRLRLAYQSAGPPAASGDWPLGAKVADPGAWARLMLAKRDANPIASGVLTNLNDNLRTGAYPESALNPSTVNGGTLTTFGKIHTWDVQGQIYAQPLYVRGLALLDGTVHNVVYVATEMNYVYAFDTDTLAQLWQAFLGPPVPSAQLGLCGNLTPFVGITSTPVIPADNTMVIYVVAKVAEDHGSIFYFLHKLDLRTGADRPGSPQMIYDVVPGTGDGSRNGQLAFDAAHHLNRPGLLLLNATLYVAFGSHCDYDPYHGWVFAYDQEFLDELGVYVTTPDGSRGGIWQAGRGLVGLQPDNSGTNYVYFMTGNGTVSTLRDGTRGGSGESFVRLKSGGMRFADDWWTVGDHACYNQWDLDLGSSGPLVIPDPGAAVPFRILGGGKEGHFYLLDALNLGHDGPPLDDIIATEQPHFLSSAYCHGALDPLWDSHHIHGGPVMWDRRSIDGTVAIYNMGEVEPLKAFQLANGTTKLSNLWGVSKFRAPSHSMPGGILSLSYSNSPPSALVWALHPLRDDALENIVEGMMTVFDATPLPCIGGGCTPGVGDLALLWHSKLNAARDDVGLFAKFTPATIADGKVFVASFGSTNPNANVCRNGCLHMYGLLKPP